MDVDEAYSESKWIFSMIVTQLEVVLIAVPMVFILRDVSTDGRYLGFMFMLWIFPMTTLLMVFLPKYINYRNKKRDSTSRVVRGRRAGGVLVSGTSGTSNVVKPRNLSSISESRASHEPETHMSCGTSIPEGVSFPYDNSHDQQSHKPEEVAADQSDGVIDNLESDDSTRAAVVLLEEPENGSASENSVEK